MVLTNHSCCGPNAAWINLSTQPNSLRQGCVEVGTSPRSATILSLHGLSSCTMMSVESCGDEASPRAPRDASLHLMSTSNSLYEVKTCLYSCVPNQLSQTNGQSWPWLIANEAGSGHHWPRCKLSSTCFFYFIILNTKLIWGARTYDTTM
jgi:hypothetical protein